MRHTREELLTLQFLVQPSPTCNAESTNELLEVYVAILVLIEDIEDVIGKFSWIAEREELLVYSAKLSLV